MADQISLTFTGEALMMARLQSLQDAVAEKILGTAIKVGALVIENEAKRNAPVLTGTLRRSVHSEMKETTKTEASALIGSDVIYAAMQEYGGTIVPKTAKVLAWKDKDGTWHRAKSVTIPAHPYIRPAFDTQKDQTREAVRAAVRDQVMALCR